MNREIEFRGKNYAGEWVYGNLMQYANGDAEIWEIFNPDIDTDCRDWAVIPESVGQYTGLKDKNGAKIFEDDIVRSLSEGYGDVYFDEGQFWINWNEGLQPLVDCYRELTVVDTIHDNPELLEV